MSIDIEGCMIVGLLGKEMNPPDNTSLYDWAVELQLNRLPLYYDADDDDTYFGFIVEDVRVDDIEGEWLSNVKYLANKFKLLTNLNPQLIGSQSVT